MMIETSNNQWIAVYPDILFEGRPSSQDLKVMHKDLPKHICYYTQLCTSKLLLKPLRHVHLEGKKSDIKKSIFSHVFKNILL